MLFCFIVTFVFMRYIPQCNNRLAFLDPTAFREVRNDFTFRDG